MTVSIFKHKNYNKTKAADIIYDGSLDDLKKETLELQKLLRTSVPKDSELADDTWKKLTAWFKPLTVTYGDGSKKEFDSLLWASHGMNVLNNLRGIKIDRNG